MLLSSLIILFLQFLLAASQIYSPSLPDLIFNIHDVLVYMIKVQNFHHYKEFYHSHHFEQIVKRVEMKHKIVYAHKQCNNACINNNDCLSYSGRVHNQSYCFPTKYHDGERMLIQQIRSYLIYQNYGGGVWWKYMDLFTNKKCFKAIEIGKCAIQTIKQLGLEEAVQQIQEKIYNLVDPTKLQQLQIQGVLIKTQYSNAQYFTNIYANFTNTTVLPNLYKSKLNQTLGILCKKFPKAQIQQICKQVMNQPLIIKINSSQYYEHTFLEPNLHKNISITRQVQIILSQNLTLSDTFIILSVGKAQNYQLLFRNTSSNQTGDFFQRFSPNQFNVSLPNKTAKSALTTSGYEQYIKIQQKSIQNRVIKLNISFSGHRIVYLRIVQDQGNTLKAGQIIRSVIQASSMYDVLFDEIQQDRLEYYELKIQLSTTIYSMSPKIILRGQKRNWNILYLCKNITENRTIVIFVNKTLFQDDAAKQCEQEKDGKINCRLKLEVLFNRTSDNYYLKNHSIVLSLRKSLSSEIVAYHEYKNDLAFTDKFVQKIELANFGPTYKLLPVQVQIRILDYILDLQIRRCKDFIPCDFKNTEQWDQHYQQITTHHNFSKQVNPYYGSGLVVGFNNNLNQLPQHMKIQNVSLFLIYKKRANDKSKIINVKEHLIMNYYFGKMVTELLSSYMMTSQSQSKRFVIRQLHNYVTRFYCVALVTDSNNKNTRIYAKAFMKNYNQEYLFEKIQKTQIGLKQSNYQQLCFPYANSFDLLIDVYVQKNKQDDTQTYVSNYEIGYTADQMRKITPITPLYLLSKSGKEIIIHSEPYSEACDSYYTILLQSKQIVIVDFEPVQQGNEILLCFFEKASVFAKIQYCLTQKSIKYWGITNKGFKGAQYKNNNFSGKLLLIKVFQNDEKAKRFEIKLRVQKAMNSYQPRQIAKDYYLELNKINIEDEKKKENIKNQKYYEIKREQIRQKQNQKQEKNQEKKEQTKDKQQENRQNKKQSGQNKQSKNDTRITQEKQRKDKQSSKPKEETSKPKEETSTPKEETSKPKEETSKPKEETSKPKEETSKPKEETSKPKEETSKPKEETSKPKEETSKPKEETSTPKEETSKPKEETSTPKEETSKPKEETSKPKEETSKPKEETSKPKEETSKPKEETSKPKEETSTPKEETSKPKEETSKPKEETSTPKEETSKPKEETSTPKEETSKPKEETSKPKEETSKPKEETSTPKEETSKPKEETSTPKEETSKPKEETSKPKEETSKPKEETSKPKEETSKPKEETSKPKEETSTPKEETSKPKEETSTPKEETSKPKEETSTPKEETSKPNQTQNNFQNINQIPKLPSKQTNININLIESSTTIYQHNTYINVTSSNSSASIPSSSSSSTVQTPLSMVFLIIFLIVLLFLLLILLLMLTKMIKIFSGKNVHISDSIFVSEAISHSSNPSQKEGIQS